jgi:uncharacterized protein YggT (Ycf19 family)
MSLLDFILNIAGVLLWVNWRSQRLDPLSRATPATLVGTIRKTRVTHLQRWQFLLIIGSLVFLRAFFYAEVGPAVNWTPQLDLGAIAPAFRANQFGQQLLFSTLSLLRVIVVFYSWLLFAAIVNRGTINPDPIQKLLVVQLGRPANWPRWLQAILPLAMGALLWLMVYPILAHLSIINWAQSALHLIGQCLLIGAAIFLSLKYLIPVILLLHLITSYVYLGNSPFWEFINTTSRNLLQPLNGLPLRLGKVDLTPLIAIALVIVVFFYPLPGFLQSVLNKFDLTIWPG